FLGWCGQTWCLMAPSGRPAKGAAGGGAPGCARNDRSRRVARPSERGGGDDGAIDDVPSTFHWHFDTLTPEIRGNSRVLVSGHFARGLSSATAQRRGNRSVQRRARSGEAPGGGLGEAVQGANQRPKPPRRCAGAFYVERRRERLGGEIQPGKFNRGNSPGEIH